jgi:hypothetical protein
LILPTLDDHECITQLDSYDTLILNPEVVSIAFIQMMMFKRQRGRAPAHEHHSSNDENVRTPSDEASEIEC